MSITIGPREAVVSRFFTLTEDVPNPHHDKRCKYGLRGIKKFAAGVVIHAVDYEQKCVIDGVEEVRKTTEYRSGCSAVFVPADLNKVFARLDPRDSCGPQTLAEAAEECGVSVGCICEYAVKHLLAKGKLTVQDVVDAYDAS
jgi:hypothetical protein